MEPERNGILELIDAAEQLGWEVKVEDAKMAASLTFSHGTKNGDKVEVAVGGIRNAEELSDFFHDYCNDVSFCLGRQAMISEYDRELGGLVTELSVKMGEKFASMRSASEERDLEK